MALIYILEKIRDHGAFPLAFSRLAFYQTLSFRSMGSKQWVYYCPHCDSNSIRFEQGPLLRLVCPFCRTAPYGSPAGPVQKRSSVPDVPAFSTATMLSGHELDEQTRQLPQDPIHWRHTRSFSFNEDGRPLEPYEQDVVDFIGAWNRRFDEEANASPSSDQYPALQRPENNTDSTPLGFSQALPIRNASHESAHRGCRTVC